MGSLFVFNDTEVGSEETQRGLCGLGRGEREREREREKFIDNQIDD